MIHEVPNAVRDELHWLAQTERSKYHCERTDWVSTGLALCRYKFRGVGARYFRMDGPPSSVGPGVNQALCARCVRLAREGVR